MNKRLLEIIKYKTGGKQTEFADLFDWSPQYLSNLLKGKVQYSAGFGCYNKISGNKYPLVFDRRRRYD